MDMGTANRDTANDSPSTVGGVIAVVQVQRLFLLAVTTIRYGDSPGTVIRLSLACSRAMPVSIPTPSCLLCIIEGCLK